MDPSKMCGINVRLLPIKSHFFFFYGGLGGVMPFMPVVAKGLGISATAVGLVFTIVPFCVFFSKPLFGYLTDYFQNIKMIVLILSTVTAVSYMSVILIPPLQNHNWINVQSWCTGHNGSIYVIPLQYDKLCLNRPLKFEAECELNFKDCDSGSSTTLTGSLTNGSDDSSTTVVPLLYDLPNQNDTLRLTFQPDMNFKCNCIAENTSFIRFIRSEASSCFPTNNIEETVYKTYQFWTFTLLAVISGTGAATVFCLSDAACYEVLGDQRHLYGRQRLWATISWGAATLLAGLLNDLASGGSEASQDYSPGFYLMLSFVIVDLIILWKIQLTKANMSINIWKDVGKIFSSCQTVAFAVSVYIIGGLTGLLWNYQFWFLQDLGANQTLLGLTIAVQCLVAEVPFFFFAGWFIKKFGYFYCLMGTLAAFALRCGLYYLLQNPWMTLPIEVLHGVTFAVFYSSMTGYASNNAPPGTEATMMGVLGGLYEGIGVATGSLLGGVGFDKIGGRNTFLGAAIVSAVCVPSLFITHLAITKLTPKEDGGSKKS